MIPFICKYCGKDTSEVEYDYLNGYDHLSCTLEQEQKQQYVKMEYGPGDAVIDRPISLDSHRQLFTVSEYMVLSTPNDQELGAKVRQLYWERKN
jgi:hypothetical protein